MPAEPSREINLLPPPRRLCDTPRLSIRVYVCLLAGLHKQLRADCIVLYFAVKTRTSMLITKHYGWTTRQNAVTVAHSTTNKPY